MSVRFTQSFKIQAVEKALNRAEGIGLKQIAESLGVGYSTLEKWIVQSRNQLFESVVDQELLNLSAMTKEKRPQDWSLEERLNLVIVCGSLDEQSISELCRKHGLYSHHVKQWKLDIVNGNRVNNRGKNQTEMKALRQENKTLKKELNRKEKALAETAALLVLQKKVNIIWANGEDS
jgi:transposase-like protein